MNGAKGVEQALVGLSDKAYLVLISNMSVDGVGHVEAIRQHTRQTFNVTN